MVNGMVKTPRVFTMDDLMRLPSVSRFHFIECGANTGMEWGNVAVPTVQYTHGMLSCSEFTGVPLIHVLNQCGVDLKNAQFVLAEGGDGASMTRTIPERCCWRMDKTVKCCGQRMAILCVWWCRVCRG
jgi:sulfane dehydrogenase subunit SoxC